jgi:hypothetical protein
MFDQISVLYQIHTQDKCVILLFTAFYIYCLFISAENLQDTTSAVIVFFLIYTFLYFHSIEMITVV